LGERLPLIDVSCGAPSVQLKGRQCVLWEGILETSVLDRCSTRGTRTCLIFLPKCRFSIPKIRN